MKNKISVLLIMALLLTSLFAGFPAAAKAAVEKGVVNTEELNVRTGAGTNYPILQTGGANVRLSRGTKVTILEELAGNWYKVDFTYNSEKLTGYVASTYVAKTVDKNVLAQNIGINAKMLSKQKVKKKASAKSANLTYNSKIVKLKKNKSVKITGVKKVSGAFWYELTFNYYDSELIGYINQNKVKISGSKLVSAYMLNSVSVKKSAGSKKTYLKVKNKIVKIKKSKKVKIIKEKTVKNTKWFYIRFIYSGKTRKGWITSKDVMFTSGSEDVIKPTSTQKPAAAPTPTVQPIALSDAEFEADMTAQGFPDSYKASLRQLHASYPYWKFKVYNTGLDWNSAVKAESTIKKSLIPNTKPASWKSSAAGAFDYVNDSYIVFDGTSWVNASSQAIAYYMDPRNWLNEKNIFMFETLSYESGYQTVDKVAKILAGTIYSGTSYTFTDDSGVVQTKTYQDTFMDAAALSGASPIHLASRMKQEVVTGSTVSNSVTGTYPGYEGIYNFFNIGASDSNTGGAIVNGLINASTGTGYMRPWNNPYKSIVGGSQYIAERYIGKGQNTIYFEKFNVTSTNTYNNQYMTNIAAPASESAKTYTAYKEWMSGIPIVFTIPVYSNMPNTVCAAPEGNNSPNNYLKSLNVKDSTGIMEFVTSPLFNAADGGSVTYNINVPSTETTLNILAQPINANAAVTGAGTITLTQQTNNIVITVTAQDGTTRTYNLIINKV